MPGPILRRAVLLSLLLLCAAVESAPPARAAQGAAPRTMHGFYRYQVRGLTAVSGGFLATMFAAQGWYVATAHRFLPNFLKILSGMATVSQDPSVNEMNDFLRSGGPNIDLSSLPVSASYGVELEFTLEEVKDAWRLKRGSYRWSSETFASVSAGEAEVTDKFRGQGSGALDPKTSSITLTTTGKRGSRQTHFDVAANFPVQVDGKSILRNGPLSMSVAIRGDKTIWEAQVPGMVDYREIKENPPGAGGGVTFSRSGPPESMMKGFDVYQDLLDSGVVEEWELWDECTATIESPSNNERMVYNLEKPARILDTALADVSPSFWENELSWLLPEISGSVLDPPRLKRNGGDFDIVYTHLPEKNSAFDFREVVADFSDRAKAAGCKNPKLTKVGYFFPRTGYNNPGPGAKAEGNPEMVVDPNWFFYWGQTAAAQGRSGELRYGGTAGICSERRAIEEVDGKEVTKVVREPAFGYAPWGKPYVVICNLEVMGFTDHNPYTEQWTDGIDTYAVTVLHELKHRDNQRKWWGAGWSRELDSDRDYIPDLLESGIAIPPPLNRKHKFFDPKERDTVGEGEYDEHYLAFMAEAQWKVLSADDEDWSCPGHQCEE